MNKEKDQKIELTQAQQNPYLAKPQDFTVSMPDETVRTVPGHGQRGKSKREYNALLREAFNKSGRQQYQGRGQELPTEVDDAKPPHTATRGVE